MTRVAILGAGVAGLGAAWRLLEIHPGWEVTVFEQGDRPGGLALTWHEGEFAADLGPHRIYTELPEIEALLPGLISREQTLIVPRVSQLLLEGHFYTYPVKPAELLRHAGPVRLAGLAASAMAAKLRWPGGKPRNFGEAMIAAFGRATYDLLLEPYARKVWKTPPREVSSEIARVRVSAGGIGQMARRVFNRKEQHGSPSALNQFTYARGGVEELVKSLATRVRRAGGRIMTSTRASGLIVAGGRVTQVRLSHSSESSSTIDADIVISTIPLTELADWLQPFIPDSESAQAAHDLAHIGLILVGLEIRRRQFSPNSWIYFPEENYIFNRAYEPRNFDESMAPPGRTMPIFEVTSRLNDAPWSRADADIAENVKTGIVAAGLVNRDEIGQAFVRRIPHAYPLYTTRYRERLTTVCRYLRRFPNLVSTGRQGLFNHNNMDHSILMGLRAAECAAANPGNAAQSWYDNLGQFSHFRIVD
ncbi:MAG: FAD-dependent oxidoreductase [bacterium]